MNDCVFCRVVSGEVSSYKVWEDDEFLAILDLFPKIRGQVVLMSKKHLDSYLFKSERKLYSSFFATAAKVGKLMDKVLGTSRTALRMEGLEINHAHLKLYPVYSSKEYNQAVNKMPKRENDETLKLIIGKFRKGE